jgi:hypothetical protein
LNRSFQLRRERELSDEEQTVGDFSDCGHEFTVISLQSPDFPQGRGHFAQLHRLIVVQEMVSAVQLPKANQDDVDVVRLTLPRPALL